jgi:hypothetical protein
MRRLTALLTLGLLLALVGCSDDGDSSTSGESGNGGNGGEGCQIVSQDEVEAATGEQVVDLVDLPTGCQWPVSEEDRAMSYEWQQVPFEGFEANREMAAGSSGMEIEEIDGLGDEAFLRVQVTSAGDVVAGETWVAVGGNAFFVRAGGLPWSDDMAAAQAELAELVADRL